jgi:hypothetical protein
MEDRIINPKTKRYIKIGGPSYVKLIEEGYKESYLNSLKNVNNLELSKITDQSIIFNDDVMEMIIRTLQLPELYALYHTSKHFKKLLNNQQLLNDFSHSFEIVQVNSFDDLIDSLINEYLTMGYNKYDVQNVFREYNIIKNAFKNNEKITICKTRRLDKNIICQAKFYMAKNGYAREIEKLSGSINDEEYKMNLKNLEYNIYYNTLLLI